MDVLPEWLDESFILKALRSYKTDDSIELVEQKIVPATFSEHFASNLYRATLSFRSAKFANSETLHVVIKVLPGDGDGLKADIAGSGPLFETEIAMYRNTLPAIHQLFERNGFNFEFAPE